MTYLYAAFFCSRGQRKRQHLDGHSDVSASLKTSDGAEDQIKDGKVSSYNEIDVIEEQVFIFEMIIFFHKRPTFAQLSTVIPLVYLIL